MKNDSDFTSSRKEQARRGHRNQRAQHEQTQSERSRMQRNQPNRDLEFNPRQHSLIEKHAQSSRQ